MAFWFGNKNKGYILTEKGKDYIANSETTKANENIENSTEENLTESSRKSERIFPSSDGWIIVEGYKGFYQSVFDNEVKLCGYDNYIFDVNGVNTIKNEEDDEKLSPCGCGIHFCRTLDNVFNYYNPFHYNGSYNTVFAKVKAEVNKKDYESFIKKDVNKFVSRRLWITEILSDEEVWKAMQINKKNRQFPTYFNIYDNSPNMSSKIYIESLEDYKNIKDSFRKSYYLEGESCPHNYMNLAIKNAWNYYSGLEINRRVEHLQKLGYSELFSYTILTLDKYDTAVLMASMDISNDMKVFFIVSESTTFSKAVTSSKEYMSSNLMDKLEKEFKESN